MASLKVFIFIVLLATACGKYSLRPPTSEDDIEIDAKKGNTAPREGKRGSAERVRPPQTSPGNGDNADPITLQLHESSLAIAGDALTFDRDITFEYKLTIRDTDCLPTLWCQFGGTTAPARLCRSASRDTIPAEILNLGLNRWSIVAECNAFATKRIDVSWYGVDPGHRELQLMHLKDNDGLSVFPLINAADCDPSRLSFECRAGYSGAYQPCANHVNGELDAAFAIRARCGAQVGPELR
jgi:hypothetical protein